MLYFIPGTQSPDKSSIERIGLSYAFEDNRPLEIGQVRPNHGPDGQSGFVVSCCAHAVYNPSTQRWFKHPNGFHFGWDNNARPSPKDLIRQDAIDGKLVRLIDDQDWLIPIARTFVVEDAKIKYRECFARTLDYVDGRWVAGNVAPHHELFFTIGQVIFDAWLESASGRFVLPDAADLCCKTICLNYRLSAVEVGALGLLVNDPQYVWKILRVVIDEEGLIQLQKKIIDEANTNSGCEGDTQATDPPSGITHSSYCS